MTNDRAKQLKKGSSSVLIILIMLCLTVFGVLSIMSAYSDYKLAAKNNSSQDSYYRLDARGEAWLMGIDAQLKQAADLARELALDIRRAPLEQHLPREAADVILEQAAAHSAQPDFSERITNGIYLYLITGLELDGAGVWYASVREDYLLYDASESDVEIMAELTTTDMGNNRYLSIALRPALAGDARYTIAQWQLWAEPFEYEPGPWELWGGDGIEIE